MVPQRNGDDDTAQSVLLVAEDDLMQRHALATMLRLASFHVYEAANAEEALRLWHSPLKFDALITDVEMPGEMDGLQLVDIIRSSDQQILLVVVSGLDLARQMRVRSQAFFRKPIETDQLIDFLQRNLGRKKDNGG
ncbi:MAG TPA: response regulator [Lacipirellulaceae bacterium]|jgi:DNA-binding NtrC family response regulator|nr:response regulator [Lacipirellulaceae bacterium]